MARSLGIVTIYCRRRWHIITRSLYLLEWVQRNECWVEFRLRMEDMEVQRRVVHNIDHRESHIHTFLIIGIARRCSDLHLLWITLKRAFHQRNRKERLPRYELWLVVSLCLWQNMYIKCIADRTQMGHMVTFLLEMHSNGFNQQLLVLLVK